MSQENNRKQIPQISYKLNTSLCQFSSVTKTAKAIEYIKHFSLVSRMNKGISENGIHHMTILMTDNNLVQTNQWKYRLQVRTDELSMKICTLSSHKQATFDNLDSFFSKLLKSNNANDLPDILIMCTHGKRTEDTIELLKTLENGNYNFTKIGINQITTTVMFDEADKNINLITDFIKNIKSVVETSNTVLRDIHFITATPLDRFWRKLAKAGIQHLDNIHHYLREEGVMNYNHEELLKYYRAIKDHDKNTSIDDMSLKPVEYASTVLEKILEKRNNHNDYYPLNIFAPSEYTQKSHDEMSDVFIKKGFTVLILNGDKHKEGFQSPNGDFLSLDKFNIKHKIKGELYDSLVKWRSLNENKDLLITGYYKIERGITFNTIGFNFTDMIVSSYHLQDMARLIQILGRANGDKKYVKVLTIWTPKKVIDEALKHIEMLDELHRRDPEIYIREDFKNNKKSTPNITIAHPTPFKTIKEVKDFLKEKLNKNVNPSAFYEIDGYILSTRLNSYYNKNKEELLSTDRLTIDKYNTITLGLNLSKTGKGQSYMVYPVYTNMTSKEVLYYVRYLKHSSSL
jgi:hypothetical protein